MRIFFTQTAYPPSIGGAQTHLHQIGLELAERHSVRVASFWRANRTDWLLGTTWAAPGGAPYNLNGIEVTPIQFNRLEKVQLAPWVAGYFIWQTTAIHHIADLLLPKLRAIAGKVDIIHHGRIGREPLAYASLALARARNVPFVLTPFHHPRWGGWLYRDYLRLYRQADAVIALTSAEMDILIELGVKPERIFVTGTGGLLSSSYSPAAFRQKRAITGPMVLFLGQKYPYKGFQQLLEAAHLVWRHRPKVQFVFIGPRTPASRRIFARINDPRILELDTVDLEEKTSALAACDLLCVPSTQECFGSVYIEAWKMSKPVIGAAIPAVAQVISDGSDGFIGPVEPAFLAEKILTLLGDPQLSQQLGAAGRSKAEQEYSWPTLAGRQEAVYRQLLG